MEKSKTGLTILRLTDILDTGVMELYLNELLKEKNMTGYMLSKISEVPQSTISEICSGKAKIERCSAGTIYKIARALGVTMESLIEEERIVRKEQDRVPYEVFKSSVCHLVKDKGDIDFLIDTLETNEIRTLYHRKWYAECFYLLAMVDYLSRENNVPLCKEYDDIRCCKMKEPVFPAGVVMMDRIFNTDQQKTESMKNAIPEFLRFNIVECEVRNVC